MIIIVNHFYHLQTLSRCCVRRQAGCGVVSLVWPMGARNLSSPGKCIYVCFNYNILVRTKRIKIVATRHVSPVQNIPKLRLWPGLWSLGSLQCSLRHLPIFNGSASLRSREERQGGEGREGKKKDGDRQEIEWGRLCLVLLEFLRAPMVWPYSQPLYRRK